MVSAVISIRIPRKLKEELEKLGIDYVKEIREYLTRGVREERAKRLIKEIGEFRQSIGIVKGNLSAEFIRETRDKR